MQPGGEYSVPYYTQQPGAAPAVHPGDFSASIMPQNFASAPPYSQFSPADFHSPLSTSYNSFPPNYEHVPNNPPPYSQTSPRAPTPSQISPFQTYHSSGYAPQPTEQPPSAAPAYQPILQPPAAPSVPYYSYGQQQHHQSSNYAPSPPPPPPPPPASQNTAPYYSFDNQPENPGASRFDHGNSVFYSENSSRYNPPAGAILGRSHSAFERDPYAKKTENRPYDDLLGEGAYAYDGGRSEPYGARGTAPGRSSSSSRMLFDDYGRALGLSSGGKEQMKVVKAVPKVETQQDAKNGVQKFRVKLLAEGSGQSSMDVLCQIGLDGIRMLDPNSNRILRIYPLENVTRAEVTDSSTFAFWSKSSVDYEPRRIRLQSNSYTTNTLLDTVTAATIQFKEMGGADAISRRASASDASKQSEQTAEKKKGFADWINIIKPVNEEKDHWVPDEAVTKCTSCGADFGAFVRRHHCRNCGDIFCDKCTSGRIALTAEEQAQQVRVCDRCMAEVTQRLSNAKESASRSSMVQSHEDLARKLQEEMEKNRKGSTGGSKTSSGSGRRMREVACPTCTVHLQVQVPSSGSTTVECGVCQHPFLVNAN